MVKKYKNKYTKAEVVEMHATVEQVCDYLRTRSLVDGVGQYMTKPFEYKSRDFKRLFVLMIMVGVGNYFGVSFNHKKILGDTIFADFYFEYQSRDKNFWKTNNRQLRKLIRKFRKMYRRRAGYVEGSDNDNSWYSTILKAHQISTVQEYKKLKEDELETADAFAHMKDYIWRGRKAQYQEYFDWPKVSHNQAKRIHKQDAERDRSKVFQSLRAFDNLTNKNNIMFDDRFIMLSVMNSKMQDNKAIIYLFDKVLKKEHTFIHAYANDMQDDSSIWSGLDDTLGMLQHYANADTKKGSIMLPDIIDNPREDRGLYRKVVSGGGYIEDGWYHGDSIGAEVMRGEFVLTSKCVRSIGRNSTSRGAEILTLMCRYYEAIASKWQGGQNE